MTVINRRRRTVKLMISLEQGQFLDIRRHAERRRVIVQEMIRRMIYDWLVTSDGGQRSQEAKISDRTCRERRTK